MSTVEFGLMLRPNDMSSSLEEVITYNRQCIERLSAGFTTLWLEDHMQVGATDNLECLTTLSYLAAAYPAFKVGTLVLSQSYRNPALVAKMMANLQVLSGGRVILGLGAGWKEDEYISYGYAFPPVKIRMEQLEEAVQVIKALWQAQPATFAGKHYHIQNAYCVPTPALTIPLLIGGGGEQRTLAIVAQHADWWNYNSCTVEEYARKMTVLKRHCERLGRNPQTLTLTYLSTISLSDDATKVVRHPQKHYIAGNATEVISELERFRALGVSHFIFRVPELASLEYFIAYVVPHFL